MGSVKDLITDRSRAGRLYWPAEPHAFGTGAWKVSGRFSVADLKDLIPPVEIPDKNFALAMIAGSYWENAAADGMGSCYVGMINADGEIVTTDDLIKSGELSDIIVMKLANTPEGKTAEDLANYHQAIEDGTMTVYVADIEAIFRAGFPLGSSVFKKIFKIAGMEDEYENLATYDEVVQGLGAIRARRDIKGMAEYLATVGLDMIPNPGHTLKAPVYTYTTKFSLTGDEDISVDEAHERIGEEGILLVERCTGHQIPYCKNRGIVNIDGKVELAMTVDGPVLTDFACTPDENRLMLVYEQDSIEYLIPANKEIQRAWFRQKGVYAAVDKAKESYGDSWRAHLLEFIDKATIEDAAHESCELMGDAIKTVANLMLGTNVFDAKPVQDWVGPFLPYASRVQRDAMES